MANELALLLPSDWNWPVMRPKPRWNAPVMPDWVALPKLLLNSPANMLPALENSLPDVVAGMTFGVSTAPALAFTSAACRPSSEGST